MDVYHQVLSKLFEETGGSDLKAVDLTDLVKRMKFHANYSTIFKELSVQGWIVETGKPDWVKLTHWGIEEIKKNRAGNDGKADELKRQANRLLAEVRELLSVTEKLSEQTDRDNFVKVEKKIMQIKTVIEGLKSKM